MPRRAYAQLPMKQVIATVVRETDLRPAEPRSERARKSAIAFVPVRHARVVAAQRTQAEAREPRVPVAARASRRLVRLVAI